MPALVLLLTFVTVYCFARGLLAMPADPLHSLIGPGLVFGGCVLFLVWAAWSGGQLVTAHIRGGNRRTRAIHEAGHYVAAQAVGGSVAGAKLTSGGGVVHARNLPNAKAEIVFQLAGGMAAGTNAGCSGDNASARRARDEYPPDQRARVWRQAQAEARRIVSSRWAEIQRVAQKLDEKGSL